MSYPAYDRCRALGGRRSPVEYEGAEEQFAGNDPFGKPSYETDGGFVAPTGKSRREAGRWLLPSSTYAASPTPTGPPKQASRW